MDDKQHSGITQFPKNETCPWRTLCSYARPRTASAPRFRRRVCSHADAQQALRSRLAARAVRQGRRLRGRRAVLRSGRRRRHGPQRGGKGGRRGLPPHRARRRRARSWSSASTRSARFSSRTTCRPWPATGSTWSTCPWWRGQRDPRGCVRARPSRPGGPHPPARPHRDAEGRAQGPPNWRPRISGSPACKWAMRIFSSPPHRSA